MGRKQNDPKISRWVFLILLVMGLISCSLVYNCLSTAFNPVSISKIEGFDLRLNEERNLGLGSEDVGEKDCCRGIGNLELWGSTANWGSDFKLNSSEDCCRACKEMCNGGNGDCLCDSWVFCGNRDACGPKFGECWLKKQRDNLNPDRQDAGEKVIWTSGLVYGKGEGIIGLETEYGTMHVKLFPDCAPHSVNYILEILLMRHCAGCKFYRAENRGSSWDSKGNHIKDASLGPPFALIQGTLEAEGTMFKKVPTEACPRIRRGSLAWVGSGPEFFISLANHNEWKNAYTVFGAVLPEDMEIAERIASLPVKPDIWGNINVTVLEKPLNLWLKRTQKTPVDNSVNSD
ncbi:hypothetical protein GIB67_021615 [Kingdonia uniflora]|uniref:PPIase cyclophilin-type domain-containing protein n=1 Tax=Kingdonia uniflora TaxID=39325 RepID=A0A7J7MDZ1_9MAGN|nr:hypothetical protein GIB67_021615 [Kingdonia uniflora]